MLALTDSKYIRMNHFRRYIIRCYICMNYKKFFISVHHTWYQIPDSWYAIVIKIYEWMNEWHICLSLWASGFWSMISTLLTDAPQITSPDKVWWKYDWKYQVSYTMAQICSWLFWGRRGQICHLDRNLSMTF